MKAYKAPRWARIISIGTAGLIALAPYAGAAISREAEAPEPAAVYAAGGTSSGTGVFFPGTAIDDGAQLSGIPHVIERGQDLELTNLDPGDASGCHRVVSLGSRRNGMPLFSSKLLCDPLESSVMKTSRLKPGTYGYICVVHVRMLGLIEIRG